MSSYQVASERAQSRAAVLQSLQNSYGAASAGNKSVPPAASSSSNKKTGTSSTDKDSKEPNSDKGVIGEIVDLISRSLEDPSMKTKQFFRDNLRGKAIVVENIKSQLEANKSKNRSIL
jgi:hypothetical protein